MLEVFEFVETPSFFNLSTGSQVEPLYFVQVTEEGVDQGVISSVR